MSRDNGRDRGSEILATGRRLRRLRSPLLSATGPPATRAPTLTAQSPLRQRLAGPSHGLERIASLGEAVADVVEGAVLQS
jgi:hypothetical protein